MESTAIRFGVDGVEATSAGPEAVRTTEAQLDTDLLRHEPAAAIGDAQRLLGEATATAKDPEGVAALREKRVPRS